MTKQSDAVAALSDAEFEEFLRTLGSLVFRTTPAAAFARHRHPMSTIQDYFDISEALTPQALAGAFWKDLAVRYATTESLSQKWFGMDASELRDTVTREGE